MEPGELGQEERSFGKLLQRHRLAAGLSQEELANRAGLSRRGVADLERGARNWPHPATARRLADALALADPARIQLLAAGHRGQAAAARAQISSRPMGLSQPVIDVVGREAMRATCHLDPRRSGAPPRNNLPAHLPSIIGRDEEREFVSALVLGNPSGLVTLTGTGGCGKTRLALSVAGALLERFEGGVWFVELASLTDPRRVPEAVMAAVGAREQPGSTSRDILQQVFSTAELLLVLDNCEHLVAACAELCAQLLQDCPSLRILATSREPLRIPGEQIYGVAPLPSPAAGESGHVDELLVYAAVRLFVERAQAVRSFRLTDDHCEAVAAICRQVDGLPLAIELAAARARSLPVETIAARLGEAFSILKGGARTSAPRQQTLRAAVDWSYALLGPKQRRVFNLLSVFVGGFTVDAAEAVTIASGVPARDALDLVSDLVDQSLVVAEPSQDDCSRYRVLEVLRQYGNERLSTSEARVAAKRAHAAYFLRLVQTADASLRASAQSQWLQRLELERDNCRAALQFARTEPDALGLPLATALGRYWALHGFVTEGRLWLNEMLNATSDAHPLRATALMRVARLAYWQRDYQSAWSQLHESLAIKRAIGDDGGIARRLAYLGQVAMARGQLEMAVALGEESLPIMRARGDTQGIGSTFIWFAWTLYATGDAIRALGYFNEALSMGLADPIDVSYATSGLIQVALARGDLRAARSHAAEVLKLASHSWGVPQHSIWIWALVVLASVEGRLEAVIRLAGAADALERATGLYLNDLAAQLWHPYVDRARAQLGPTASQRLFAEGAAMSFERVCAEAVESRRV